MIARHRNRGRMATYSALAGLALAIGVAVPAQAATSVQIAGDSAFQITAVARTSDTSLKKRERLHARATLKYEASFLGIPLPATARYMNSIPLTFDTPRLDEWNASLASKLYSSRYDKWLGTRQWIVSGSENFRGSKRVSVKGSAIAEARGARYFHGGSGVDHWMDANAALRITVR